MGTKGYPPLLLTYFLYRVKAFSNEHPSWSELCMTNRVHLWSFEKDSRPRNQLPGDQLPPDQLLIKVVMKCDSAWVNVDSRGVPLQWSVPLQRIVHFKEMHHFKHYSVINHCHISISKVQLVVVAGIHTWKNMSSQYFWDYWCDVKGASYHRDENQLVWSQHYAKFVQRDVKLSTLRDFRMEDAT